MLLVQQFVPAAAERALSAPLDQAGQQAVVDTLEQEKMRLERTCEVRAERAELELDLLQSVFALRGISYFLTTGHSLPIAQDQ